MILANMREKECTEYFKNVELEKRTPNSIIDLSVLQTQFPEIRNENIAYDDEEYILGVRGVASGIKDSHNHFVGAICVIGPSVRLSKDKLKKIASTVRDFAERISKALIAG